MRVDLVIDPNGRAERFAMNREEHGYFAVDRPMPAVGLRYGYVLDGGPFSPDPASCWQPDGVDTPSAVAFTGAFAWDEGNWKGIERRDLVFYELHVGTFTPKGTFEAIIPRLGALRELGITAIELMPVAQFSGRWNWGYDGVFSFAVHNTYGGPDGLHRLVEACHRAGLAVVLDVVYNHFGPEGNVLPRFGDYFTEMYKAPWGAAVNYDGAGCDAVRALVLQNVKMWVRDYRFDGLRLDAADQIFDRGPSPILAEIGAAAHREADRLGRPVHVFAETDLNDAPRFLHTRERGGYAQDGHWNDDFHHAVHNVLTGETSGYYIDFAAGPGALAKSFEDVFVNNGNFSVFRNRRHGTPATEFPGDRFVAFVQNHDQVGNRLKSDRYAASLPQSALRLAAGLLLLAPRLPLLFMGEEYGETSPFPFFCDYHSPELVNAVRKGRKAEFASFGWEEEIPDPVAASTRESAVLSWSWSDPERTALRTFYQHLLKRRLEMPALRDFGHAQARLHGPAEDVLEIVRGAALGQDKAVTIVFNLSRDERPVPKGIWESRAVFRSEPGRERADSLSENLRVLRPYEFVMFEPGEGSL